MRQILPSAADGKTLVIFGAGVYGQRLAKILRLLEFDFSCFVDNCPRGGAVCGKKVFLPQRLEEEGVHRVFVLVAADRPEEDMCWQLEEMGLRAGQQYMSARHLIRRYRPTMTADTFFEDTATPEHPYEMVNIGLRYAPWRLDSEFVRTYETVKDHTLVDMYRLWTLWSMVAQASKTEGMLVEVGVWRGGSGCLLARRWNLLGRREPVVLCDTFEGVVKTGGNDPWYHGREHADTSREVVEHLVKTMQLPEVRILGGSFPDDTAEEVPDGRVAFAHIAVDVYASCKDIVRFLWPRLSHGGIMVFDDYGFMTTPGVRMYLDEIAMRDDLVFMAGAYGQGILIKR